jgi:hypothetical protein
LNESLNIAKLIKGAIIWERVILIPFFLQKTTTVQRITCVLIGLIKWEFEYALCAFQDELVDHLLFIKDKIYDETAI